jgi:hypothetical protein
MLLDKNKYWSKFFYPVPQTLALTKRLFTQLN